MAPTRRWPKRRQTSPVTVELPACDYSVFVKPESECGKALDFISKRGVDYNKRTATRWR